MGLLSLFVFCKPVFKLLELESPKRIVSDTILMPPKSTNHLKANINGAVYQLNSSSTNTVKVTKDGIVKSTNNWPRRSYCKSQPNLISIFFFRFTSKIKLSIHLSPSGITNGPNAIDSD